MHANTKCCMCSSSHHGMTVQLEFDFFPVVVVGVGVGVACNCIEINRYMHRKFKLDDHKNMYECSIGTQNEQCKGERERKRKNAIYFRIPALHN